jgi:hypothetical protein
MGKAYYLTHPAHAGCELILCLGTLGCQNSCLLFLSTMSNPRLRAGMLIKTPFTSPTPLSSPIDAKRKRKLTTAVRVRACKCNTCCARVLGDLATGHASKPFSPQSTFSHLLRYTVRKETRQIASHTPMSLLLRCMTTITTVVPGGFSRHANHFRASSIKSSTFLTGFSHSSLTVRRSPCGPGPRTPWCRPYFNMPL